jgi:hypothetical protein
MQTTEKKTAEHDEKTENQNVQIVVTEQSHVSPSRNRIWNNLANIKFKALYACECSRMASRWGRLASFGLALTSASSVATWALWQQHTRIWAIIIGVGQLAQVALPYVPFLKNEKEYLGMSFEFENLYLEYEQLWYDLQDKTVTETSAKERLTQLRAREIEIEKAGVRCPKKEQWIERINTETESVLKLDFS